MNQSKPVRPIRRDELKKFKNIVVVFGSRTFENRAMFKDFLLGFIESWELNAENTVFVSGLANGPDKLIIEWCVDNGWRWHECAAKWEDLNATNARIKTNNAGRKYNANAGFDRNQEMANVSTHGLGFWDGKSPGTKDMVDRCNALKVRLRLIRLPG